MDFASEPGGISKGVAVGSCRLDVGPPVGIAVAIPSQAPAGAAKEKARLARAVRQVDRDEKHSRSVDDLEDVSQRADDATTQVERANALWIDVATGRLDVSAVNNEIDSLFAVLQKLDRSGRFDEQLRLARALSRLLAVALRWLDLLRSLRRLLAKAERRGDKEARAWALHELGTLYLAAGQLVRADRALSESINLRRDLGDGRGLAATERNLLVLCRTLRRMMDAGQLVERKRPGRWFHMSNAALLVLVLLMLGGATAAADASGLLSGSSLPVVLATVTRVSPSHGPASGHTPVTISGTNLAKATAVMFGNRPATDVRKVGDPKLVVKSPPGTGTVDVRRHHTRRELVHAPRLIGSVTRRPRR